MAALVFDKCCGCIELKTGCFIIGYLNLVFTLIFTILTAMAVVGGAVLANKDDPETHNAGIAVSVVSGIMLVFLLIGLAFSIVLLVGLHNNKPGHLKAYLVYSLILLIVIIINFVATCATTAATAGYIVQTLISILLSIYFILVIRSMYFQMKDPSRGPAIYSAA